MQCELCGKDTPRTKTVIVEGATFSVCEKCAKYGKEKPKPVVKRTYTREQWVEMVVSDARYLIKEAREKRKMRQVDFAKMLQVKESLIHNVEAGHIPLSIPLAKKIEEALDIKLTKRFRESL